MRYLQRFVPISRVRMCLFTHNFDFLKDGKESSNLRIKIFENCIDAVTGCILKKKDIRRHPTPRCLCNAALCQSGSGDVIVHFVVLVCVASLHDVVGIG